MPRLAAAAASGGAIATAIGRVATSADPALSEPYVGGASADSESSVDSGETERQSRQKKQLAEPDVDNMRHNRSPDMEIWRKKTRDAPPADGAVEAAFEAPAESSMALSRRFGSGA